MDHPIAPQVIQLVITLIPLEPPQAHLPSNCRLLIVTQQDKDKAGVCDHTSELFGRIVGPVNEPNIYITAAPMTKKRRGNAVDEAFLSGLPNPNAVPKTKQADENNPRGTTHTRVHICMHVMYLHIHARAHPSPFTPLTHTHMHARKGARARAPTHCHSHTQGQCMRNSI